MRSVLLVFGWKPGWRQEIIGASSDTDAVQPSTELRWLGDSLKWQGFCSLPEGSVFFHSTTAARSTQGQCTDHSPGRRSTISAPTKAILLFVRRRFYHTLERNGQVETLYLVSPSQCQYQNSFQPFLTRNIKG